MSDQPPRLLRFNINEYARVRLTPATLALWRADAEEMRARFKDHPDHELLWPLTPPTDAAGYWRTQLWQIVRLIGPECVAGGKPLQDSELVLELRDEPADTAPEKPAMSERQAIFLTALAFVAGYLGSVLAGFVR